MFHSETFKLIADKLDRDEERSLSDIMVTENLLNKVRSIKHGGLLAPTVSFNLHDSISLRFPVDTDGIPFSTKLAQYQIISPDAYYEKTIKFKPSAPYSAEFKDFINELDDRADFYSPVFPINVRNAKTIANIKRLINHYIPEDTGDITSFNRLNKEFDNELHLDSRSDFTSTQHLQMVAEEQIITLIEALSRETENRLNEHYRDCMAQFKLILEPYKQDVLSRLEIDNDLNAAFNEYQRKLTNVVRRYPVAAGTNFARQLVRLDPNKMHNELMTTINRYFTVKPKRINMHYPSKNSMLKDSQMNHRLVETVKGQAKYLQIDRRKIDINELNNNNTLKLQFVKDLRKHGIYISDSNANIKKLLEQLQSALEPEFKSTFIKFIKPMQDRIRDIQVEFRDDWRQLDQKCRKEYNQSLYEISGIQ